MILYLYIIKKVYRRRWKDYERKNRRKKDTGRDSGNWGNNRAGTRKRIEIDDRVDGDSVGFLYLHWKEWEEIDKFVKERLESAENSKKAVQCYNH